MVNGIIGSSIFGLPAPLTAAVGRASPWAALLAVLVAILRKRPKLDLSLNTMLQVLSVTPFERIPLFPLFSGIEDDKKLPDELNQLKLL